MSWFFLIVAGAFEVVWAMSMKQSQGFSRLGPTLLTLAGMVVSFWFLALALRSLPLGTAYVIWTGIGALGAFVVGIVLLGEALTPLRLVAASLILGGILLMAFSSGIR